MENGFCDVLCEWSKIITFLIVMIRDWITLAESVSPVLRLQLFLRRKIRERDETVHHCRMSIDATSTPAPSSLHT
jgi:hypothetical protein